MVQEDGRVTTTSRAGQPLSAADQTLGGATEVATPQSAARPANTAGRAVREVIETLLLAALIFFLVRLVVLNFRVDGESMTPSLQNEQMLLVNVNAYRHFDLNGLLNLIPGQDREDPWVVWPLGMPERGDIVVFNPTPDAAQPYIKRIIGLPGERITFQDGFVYVNGQRLDEPYLRGARTRCRGGDICDIVVSPGYVFVLGDNRNNSTDSRVIGEVPLSSVVGKAWLSYWPLDMFGLVPHYDYPSLPETSTDTGGASQVAVPATQAVTRAERRARNNALREAQGVPTRAPLN